MALQTGQGKFQQLGQTAYWQPHWEAGDPGVGLGGSTHNRLNRFRILPPGMKSYLDQDREHCLVARMPPSG